MPNQYRQASGNQFDPASLGASRINETIPNSIDVRLRLPVIITEIDRSIPEDTSAETAQNVNNTFFDLVNDVFVYSNVLPASDSNNFFLAVEEETYLGDIYQNYYGVTELDTDFLTTIFLGDDNDELASNETAISIRYDERELRILENKYTTEPLSFLLEQAVNFSFERGEGDTSNTRQGMIDYDSISSLGAISDETVTISATTGSVTGLITEQAETITDVGGLSGAGRDRTIEGGGVGGANVRTSGY